MNNSSKVKILFVCLGNICRSPMAESVMRAKVENQGLGNAFQIDSAGTAGYHIGEWPDHRTLKVLKDHGISKYSKARQLQAIDLNAYDYILAMDHSNLADILLLNEKEKRARIELFRIYDDEPGDLVVPDPYYGGMADFEHVYDMVDRCADNFLNSLKK